VIHSVKKTASVLQVSMALIKQQLRVTHDDDDSIIYHYAMVAQDYVETMTGLSFTNSNFTLTLPLFDNIIQLDKRPLTAINSITYYDPLGVQQTLASTQYQISYDPFARLVFPTAPRVANRTDAVTIDYNAYVSIPVQATQCILMLVSHLYEHREAVSELPLREVPMGVERFIENLCVWEG
jgi:uncharacterized phiE125 gp8 family phage protein